MATKISTNNAPAAIGPYSQAIVAGDFLFASGQIPINPATGNVEATDITGQAEQSMKNVGAILEAAGASYDKIGENEQKEERSPWNFGITCKCSWSIRAFAG